MREFCHFLIAIEFLSVSYVKISQFKGKMIKVTITFVLC